MSVQVKLNVVGGKASKRAVLLKLPTTIGRSRDADLTVAHPQVSRKHCELIEFEGLVVIRDVGSLNGTYVGSKRVKEAPLLPDAKFSIGPLMFHIEYQFDGDRNRLPPTIPDERTLASESTGEISKTMPVKPESDKAVPESKEAVSEQKEAEPEPKTPKPESGEDAAEDDAALDDFLKGIT